MRGKNTTRLQSSVAKICVLSMASAQCFLKNRILIGSSKIQIACKQHVDNTSSLLYASYM